VLHRRQLETGRRAIGSEADAGEAMFAEAKSEDVPAAPPRSVHGNVHGGHGSAHFNCSVTSAGFGHFHRRGFTFSQGRSLSIALEFLRSPALPLPVRLVADRGRLHHFQRTPGQPPSRRSMPTGCRTVN